MVEYLCDLLTNTNKQTHNIISVICEKEDDTKFDRLIKKLAHEDFSNIDIQKRKWRACLLKILLNDISEDCLQGLLQLMEFWESMGDVADCPQNFPNEKTVKDYFTQESYEHNLNKNREWLQQEISNIIELER